MRSRRRASSIRSRAATRRRCWRAASTLATRFNRTAARNKYEIDAIATYGAYMSRQLDLADLKLGVTGRHRAPVARPLTGRATAQTEGTDEIRALFERQSGFVEVKFYKRMTDIPRPFSVVFRAGD